MFGSLKVNGTKVSRQITAKEALPGFLVIVTPPKAGANITSKTGDLVIKTPNGYYFRVHENPTPLNWKDNTDSGVIVQYADVELTFKAVEDA